MPPVRPVTSTDVAGGGLGDRGVDGDVGGAAVDVDADAGRVVGGADRAAVDGDGAGEVGDVDAVAGLAVEVDAADGQSSPDMPLRLMPSAAAARGHRGQGRVERRRVDQQRGAVVGGDLVGAAGIGRC